MYLFANEAVQVHWDRTAFSGPAHVNPSRPSHVSFRNGFLWDCASRA